jgi:hypothetical protein
VPFLVQSDSEPLSRSPAASRVPRKETLDSNKFADVYLEVQGKLLVELEARQKPGTRRTG